MLVKPNNFHYIICIGLTLLCLSCNDDSSIDDHIFGPSNTNGWISNLGLESNRGELSISNSNDYLVVGSEFILKVDVNGNVTEEIQQAFSQPTSDLSTMTRIFDDKIYRFKSIGFSSEDSEKNIELEIYDKNGNLIELMVLDATYTLIDVIIEEDKMTFLTWNWNDPNTLGARTHIFQVDNNGKLLFENRLASFPNITGRIFDLVMCEDGSFLFEYDKTLYKVNNNFEPISSILLTDRVHHFVEDLNGDIYVGGITQDNSNYLIKLDEDLNKVNEISFNNELLSPIHPSLTNYAIGSLAVHNGTLYTLEVAFEYGQELRLQCFDLDFNKKDEFIIEGSGPLSDLMINELGSVSFLYGNPFVPFEDFPDFTTPTEARLFKLDVNCQLPELIINN